MRKFEPPLQKMLAKSSADRSPYEEQLAELALRQVHDASENAEPKIGAKDKAAYQALKGQLSAFEAIRPKSLLRGLLMTDVGPTAPPTFVPGDSQHALEPGFPVVFDDPAIIQPPIVPTAASTGRRLALARWIAQPANPLTSRVMVNRIWQYHFGRGLVQTSGDFGRLGSVPSHPELLDYLAGQFVAGGWSIKAMHRLIMTSATYRQSSLTPAGEVAQMKDPDNRLLWRMNPRRLEAEQLRDAMLAVSGELRQGGSGPSADPSTPAPSIYTKLVRNHPDPLLEAFDAPEAFGCVPVRNQTTTATQALLLINSENSLGRADAFADRVRKEVKSLDPEALVDAVYRLAYGRTPESEERESAIRFITRNGSAASNLVDFCHAVLNSSEFLYVD